MGQEIERKFLISEAPIDYMQSARRDSLVQGYLYLKENRELRIRKKGTLHYLTEKTGDGLVRGEKEAEISEDVFTMLWPLTEGKRVEKLRFTFDYNQYPFEIDIYSGDLEGLMVMEVEFKSESEAKAFTPPSFCTHDITNDKRFKNACLATQGKPPHS